MQEQTPHDTDVINTNTLRTLRKRRGWSQAVLAEKCGCRPEQISRWERSESSTPRYRLRTALAKALGVEWKDLTRPLPDDGRKAGDAQREKVQLNVRIDQRERNALSLVCLRYGVQPAEVVTLAPLLFLITAEQSLAWRRRNLGALDEVLDKIPPLAPHLSGELEIAKGRAEEAMFTEQESLEARDIFGRRLEPEYTQPGNPYMAYLEIRTQDLSLATNRLLGYIETEYPGEIDYMIWAEEDLREATGLTGERKHDDKILLYIQIGAMNLEEIINKKGNFSEDEYFAWIDQHYNKLEEQSSKLLDEL